MSETMPRLAAVILNYNSGSATVRLLHMLRQKGPKNLQIVVVDNCSSDDSRSRLRTEAEKISFTLIEAPRNGGYAYGNNLGIKQAISDGAQYITILNSDIEFETNFMSPIVQFLETRPDVAIASPVLDGADGFHDYGRQIRMGTTHFVKLVSKPSSDKPMKVETITGACFIVRTSAITKVGLIPEPYFLNFEETEWCLNFQRAQYEIYCLPGVHVQHASHGAIGQVSGMQTYFIKRNLVLFNRRVGTRKDVVKLMAKVIPLGIVLSIKQRSMMPLLSYLDGWTEKNRFAPKAH